ncbi:MAG: hypothetical protein P8P45_01760 [Flavobacteriales bacterium]|nr:hypothetical protein [Flavobacteriales bacterium]
MEKLTPNPLSDAPSFPQVDQWSAPERAISFVLAHVRSTGKGSQTVAGSVHLN